MVIKVILRGLGGPVMPYGDVWIWVNIRLGNGLLLDSTKPLPEPMFIIKGILWGAVSQELLKKWIWKRVWKLHFWYYFHMSTGADEFIKVTPDVNALRPIQNGRRFADDSLKCIFLNENVWISIKISLNFIPKGPINNIPALFQIMAWRRPGDKPLSEPMKVSLLTHVCVTQPQWVNALRLQQNVSCRCFSFSCNTV